MNDASKTHRRLCVFLVIAQAVSSWFTELL
jgi:hypothetical protein